MIRSIITEHAWCICANSMAGSWRRVKAAMEWDNGFWTSTNEWLKWRQWPVGSEPSARALQRPKSGLRSHYAHLGQPWNPEFETFYLNSSVVKARMHPARLKFRKFQLSLRTSRYYFLPSISHIAPCQALSAIAGPLILSGTALRRLYDPYISPRTENSKV